MPHFTSLREATAQESRRPRFSAGAWLHGNPTCSHLLSHGLLGCHKSGEQREEHNWILTEGQVITLVRHKPPTLDLNRTPKIIYPSSLAIVTMFFESPDTQYLVQRQPSSHTLCLTEQPKQAFHNWLLSCLCDCKDSPASWRNHSSTHTPLLPWVTQVCLSSGA